jgi:hypothetical protein
MIPESEAARRRSPRNTARTEPRERLVHFKQDDDDVHKVKKSMKHKAKTQCTPEQRKYLIQKQREELPTPAYKGGKCPKKCPKKGIVEEEPDDDEIIKHIGQRRAQEIEDRLTYVSKTYVQDSPLPQDPILDEQREHFSQELLQLTEEQKMTIERQIYEACSQSSQGSQATDGLLIDGSLERPSGTIRIHHICIDLIARTFYLKLLILEDNGYRNSYRVDQRVTVKNSLNKIRTCLYDPTTKIEDVRIMLSGEEIHTRRYTYPLALGACDFDGSFGLPYMTCRSWNEPLEEYLCMANPLCDSWVIIVHVIGHDFEEMRKHERYDKMCALYNYLGEDGIMHDLMDYQEMARKLITYPLPVNHFPAEGEPDEEEDQPWSLSSVYTGHWIWPTPIPPKQLEGISLSEEFAAQLRFRLNIRETRRHPVTQ